VSNKKHIIYLQLKSHTYLDHQVPTWHRSTRLETSWHDGRRAEKISGRSSYAGQRILYP